MVRHCIANSLVDDILMSMLCYAQTFQIPEVNTSTNGDVAEVKAPVAGRGGGKPQGKAAKMRAVTRGDDTTAAMSPGAVAMQVS